MRFSHLNLVVANPQASAEFYRRFLVPDGTATWLGESLHLRNRQAVDLAFQKGVPKTAIGSHHGFLAESVSAIDNLLADLKNNGVRITNDCDEPGFRSVKFIDPDGYEIEVYWEADWP